MTRDRPSYYVLGGADGRRAIPVANALEWAVRHERDLVGRRVAFTDLPGGLSVSTVFLGIDHAFGGPPPAV